MQINLLGFKNIKRGLSRTYFIMIKTMMHPKLGDDISGNSMGDIKGGYSNGAAWPLPWSGTFSGCMCCDSSENRAMEESSLDVRGSPHRQKKNPAWELLWD